MTKKKDTTATAEKVGREWMQARDIIAGVFLEVAPSYGKDRCEMFAAAALARLADAGILTIRKDDHP